MQYTVYTNKNNPHSTIHREGCFEIKKHGGEHEYNQGWYKSFNTLEEARTYCTTISNYNKGKIIEHNCLN